MEIIEGQRAAAQQELAQNGDLVVLGNPGARFDQIDPRIREERRVVERDDDGLVDLNRGDRLDASREILLGCRVVDRPALVVGVAAGEARQLGAVVANAREGPLQSGELRVRPRGVLGRGIAWRHRSSRHPEERGTGPEQDSDSPQTRPTGRHRNPGLTLAGGWPPSMAFRRSSCARSKLGAISSAASASRFASAARFASR